MHRSVICCAFALALTLACARPRASSPAPLENRVWRLIEVAGQPAIEDGSARAAQLRFVPDSGRVVGSTGCNRLNGPFTRSGDALRFGPLASTRMACAESRRNQQEQAFMFALSATERHRIDADTLTLIGSAGRVARLIGAAPM